MGSLSFTLNNGVKIPGIGKGYVAWWECRLERLLIFHSFRCWLGPEGGLDVAEEMCKNALKVIFQHYCILYGEAPTVPSGRVQAHRHRECSLSFESHVSSMKLLVGCWLLCVYHSHPTSKDRFDSDPQSMKNS